MLADFLLSSGVVFQSFGVLHTQKKRKRKRCLPCTSNTYYDRIVDVLSQTCRTDEACNLTIYGWLRLLLLKILTREVTFSFDAFSKLSRVELFFFNCKNPSFVWETEMVH